MIIYNLYKSLILMRNKDNNLERRELIQFLEKQNSLSSRAYRFLSKRGSFIRGLISITYGSFYSLAAIPSNLSSNKLIIYNKEREKEAIEPFVNGNHSEDIKFGRPSFISFCKLTLQLPGIFFQPKVFQIFSIIFLFTKYDLYISMRLTASLFSYIVLSNFLNDNNYEVYLSTEGEPFSLPALLISMDKGIAINFISHAYITNEPLPIKAKYAFFKNQENYNAYIKAGATFEDVDFGSEQLTPPQTIPLDSPKILICLSKMFAPKKLISLLEGIHSSFDNAKITIRPHPSNLTDLTLILSQPNISISSHLNIKDDLQECDLMIGGQSNALLDSLSCNKASLFYKEMDLHSTLFLPFVTNKLIFEIEINNSLFQNMINANEFYQSNKNLERLQLFF